MRDFTRAFALVSLVALAACATPPAGNGGQPVDPKIQALNIAKKAVTTGHIAHQAAAVALDTAAKAGVLHGSAAGTAKALLDQSETYLTEADAAIAAADAIGATGDAAQAVALIGQAESALAK